MEKHLNSSITSSSPVAGNSTQTPTTFIQADANTFRDLVQKLTGFGGGAASTEKLPVSLTTSPAGHGRLCSKPSINNIPGRRPPFKLHERRPQLHTMRKLEIKLGFTTLRNSPPSHDQARHRLEYSPIPSPVTPLGTMSFDQSQFNYSSSATVSPSSPAVNINSEEEKAIAEKGFYLHPSPLNTPRGRGRGTQSPELLTLFPLTSSPTDQEKRD